MYRFNNMLFGPGISVAFTKQYENMISAYSLYTPPPTYTSAKMHLMIITNMMITKNNPQPEFTRKSPTGNFFG